MCEMGVVMTIYGYARVSTDGQSLAAQIAELKAAKCIKIFKEKISGARSNRKQLLADCAVIRRAQPDTSPTRITTDPRTLVRRSDTSARPREPSD